MIPELTKLTTITVHAEDDSIMAVKKTASGAVDKRTKEGKAICERMAKARAAAAKKAAARGHHISGRSE